MQSKLYASGSSDQAFFDTGKRTKKFDIGKECLQENSKAITFGYNCTLITQFIQKREPETYN